MSIIDPHAHQYGNAILGGSLSSGAQATPQKAQAQAQSYFPDTAYIQAQQVLSIHKLTHGWIVKCGQKTYPCADNVETLLDTISLALVHHSMDTNK